MSQMMMDHQRYAKDCTADIVLTYQQDYTLLALATITANHAFVRYFWRGSGLAQARKCPHERPWQEPFYTTYLSG